ncbi:MAG: DUF3795 domain-containing protein [Clostridia bacterium]
MDKTKGIAYCGLACCLCSENETCLGCRNEGCYGKESCKSFSCCKAKRLNGCWECNDFPCKNSMFEKLRIRTFVKFISEYGEAALIDALEKNEAKGILYHYKGQIIGDYDKLQSEEKIKKLIQYGE